MSNLPDLHTPRTSIEDGRYVLELDTPVVLDCNRPDFDQDRRDRLERQVFEIAQDPSFDEVRVRQI